MEIKNTKIRVRNEEENIIVQEKLFSLGCSWFKETRVENLDAVELYIDENLYIGYCSDRGSNYFENNDKREISVKQLFRKSYKPKPEDLTRFMAYGQGCYNKSELLNTEKELKEELKKVTNDNDWTGRIIGYKLVPLFETEKSVRLKSLTKTKKRKT